MLAVRLADFEDGDDVRMIERRRGAGFLFEAPNALGIARIVCGQDFQRDLASQARVGRQIDLAHAAAANARKNLVWPKLSPGIQLGGGRFAREL